MSDQILLVLGIALFACGLGAYFNPNFFRKLLGNYIDNPAIVYLNGFINLALAFILIYSHNTWVTDWPVVVTIIGWTALVRGLWIIIFPQHYIRMFKAFWSRGHVVGEAVLLVAIGALLIYGAIS